MNGLLQTTPYAILTGLAAVMSAWLVLYAWKRRHAAGATELMLMMSATGTWSFFYTLELLSKHLELQIAFAKLEYFGIVVVGPAWLLFTLSYSGYRQRLPRIAQTLLWVPPAITLGLVSTNESHHLIWQKTTQIHIGQYAYLYLQHGSIFWLQASYTYLLLFLGTAILARIAVHALKGNRREAIGLLIGIMPPWVLNVFYLSGHSPVPYVDFTVVALALTGFILLYDLYRYDMLSIIPLAAETILDTIHEGTLVINPTGLILNINRAAAQLLGLSQAQTESLHINNLPIASIVKTLHPGAVYETYLKGRYLQIRIMPLEKHPHYHLIHIQDVTRDRENALRMERQNEYLSQINEITQVILSKENEQDILPELVQHVARLFKADHAVIIGADETGEPEVLATTDDELKNKQVLKGLAQKVNHQNAIHIESDLLNAAADCRIRTAMVMPLIADNTRLGTLIVGYTTSNHFNAETALRGQQVSAQISLALAKIHLLEEVRHLAIVDDLTGAYNHRFLNLTGQHLLTQAMRYQEPFSLLFFDLDHFKQINDQYGHLTGDLVLSQIARRCQQAIRQSDWLIRYGGDEFIILLPHTDSATALKVARRVQEAIITRSIKTTAGDLQIHISMGVASLTPNIERLDTLIHNADTALYHAKENGRNQIVAYTENPL